MEKVMSLPQLHTLTPREGRSPRLLVPTDFSAGANKALLHALSLAHQVGAEVHLLHVVTRPEPGTVVPEFPDVEAYCRHQDTVAVRHLRRIVETARQRHVSAQFRVQYGDDTAAEILDYARLHGVAMTVMGTHAHKGGVAAPLGSTAAHVVRLMPGPVFTVTPHVEAVPGLIRAVLVPIDFSEPALHALALAVEMAVFQHARITLLHVLEPARQRFFFEGQVTELALQKSLTIEQAHAALRGLAAETPGIDDSVVTSVVQGKPAEVIARLAQWHHLVIQGAHGRTDIDLLALGQVAEEVIRTAPCPVITVKRVRAE